MAISQPTKKTTTAATKRGTKPATPVQRVNNEVLTISDAPTISNIRAPPFQKISHFHNVNFNIFKEKSAALNVDNPAMAGRFFNTLTRNCTDCTGKACKNPVYFTLLTLDWGLL